MKHTSTYYTAERWVKNAARTAYKQMTYDNAMKAMAIASAIPMGLAAGSAIRAGMSAGRIGQVASGLAQGAGAISAARGPVAVGHGGTWTPTAAGLAFDRDRRR